MTIESHAVTGPRDMTDCALLPNFHNVHAIISVPGAVSWKQEYENILATEAVCMVLAV